MRQHVSIDMVVVAVGVSLVIVWLFGGGVGTVAGGDDASPLADAGLDQTVTEGSTVYLDAGGSTDPESSIDGYEWAMETPGGETMEPDCSTCVQASFTANESGTYAVSVTVTDEDGRTDTDTLYVTVEPYDPPEVSVEGPSTVPVGEERTVTMEATATEEPLSSVLWHHDGAELANAALSSDWSVTHETNVTFTEPGVHEVNATVVDDLGYQASDGVAVRVIPAQPYLEVTITEIDGPVPEGDSLTVSATVENTGDASTTQPVSLTREGSPVGTHDDVSVEPGEERSLEFTWDTETGDAGTYEFVAHTANETDSQESTVEAAAQGALEGSPCQGISTTECLMQIGELESEITNMNGNLAEVDLELAVPEELQDDLDLESVEIDPAEHDVAVQNEDGETLEVDDDGTVEMQDNSEQDGTVEVNLEEDVQSSESSYLGADEGDSLEDDVGTPEKEDNFESPSDLDKMSEGDGGSSDTSSGTESDTGDTDDDTDSSDSGTGGDTGDSGYAEGDYIDIDDMFDGIGGTGYGGHTGGTSGSGDTSISEFTYY